MFTGNKSRAIGSLSRSVSLISIMSLLLSVCSSFMKNPLRLLYYAESITLEAQPVLRSRIILMRSQLRFRNSPHVEHLERCRKFGTASLNDTAPTVLCKTLLSKSKFVTNQRHNLETMSKKCSGSASYCFGSAWGKEKLCGSGLDSYPLAWIVHKYLKKSVKRLDVARLRDNVHWFTENLKDTSPGINLADFCLKGQCHEMVVEVRPWSGRLGLN
jgi:hypothetical protein